MATEIIGPNIVIENNVDGITAALNKAYLQALEKCGMAGEGFAKDECPVDTGRLVNSITHKVNGGELAVYIGTNVEYGVYVEHGTGQQSDVGGNPTLPGMKPHPFLRPAATKHGKDYRNIIQNTLKNG